MAIPEQVKRQQEQAEALLQSLRKPEESAPETPETPVSTPAETTTETKAEPQTDWQQRFKVMEGKYRAEVPRFAAENRQMREELEALKQEIEANKPKPAERPTEAEFELLDQYFDDSTRKELDRFVDKKVQERLKGVTEEVQVAKKLTAQQAQSVFWKDVLREFPDYQGISTDDGFNEWLAQPIPLSPFTRYQMMMNAYEALDSSRFSEFLRTWKGEQGKPAPVNPALQSKVVPQKAAGSSTGSSQKQTYTPQQYAAMSDKARRASLDGKREEARQITSELDAALREGRINRN